MTTQKPTAERRLRRALPLAAAALLLACLPDLPGAARSEHPEHA
jgi:hypothetical protein